jgi:DNA-binding MarR family transcriptional regulator
MASGGTGGRTTSRQALPPGATDLSFEHQIVTGLAKVGLALRAGAWRAAVPRHLTPTQTHILAVLRRAAGPLRLSVIADDLAASPPTASDAVAALVHKRLVTKTRAHADARAVDVQLTAAGRRTADEVTGWPEPILAAVSALAPADQGALLRALTTLIGLLQARGEISVARMCVTCRYFRPNAHGDPDRPHHCDLIDTAFGDRALRIHCPDHEQAERDAREAAWTRFIAGG